MSAGRPKTLQSAYSVQTDAVCSYLEDLCFVQQLGLEVRVKRSQVLPSQGADMVCRKSGKGSGALREGWRARRLASTASHSSVSGLVCHIPPFWQNKRGWRLSLRYCTSDDQLQDAGHMVPTDQPQVALQLFTNFLAAVNLSRPLNSAT